MLIHVIGLTIKVLAVLFSLSFKCFLESIKNLGDSLDIGIVPHHTNPPHFTRSRAQAPRYFNQMTKMKKAGVYDY